MFYVSNSKAVPEHNLFDRAVVFVSAPVQWVTVATLDAVGSTWTHYINLVGVQEENVRLHAENARLAGEVAAREELRHENARLRQLMDLRERAPEVRMVMSQVVGTSPSPLFRSVRIDRGARDNVELGAAVVGADGVVGRVAALGEYYADVMLLVDANSSTDVLVQRTRARARVRGQGGDDSLGVEVQYLQRTADVEPGDVLITSGLGKAFPKGLRIGRITSVERRAFGLYQRAVVQPSIDFGRLESVMVILKGFSADTSLEAPDKADAQPASPLLEPHEELGLPPATLPSELPPRGGAAGVDGPRE